MLHKVDQAKSFWDSWMIHGNLACGTNQHQDVTQDGEQSDGPSVDSWPCVYVRIDLFI